MDRVISSRSYIIAFGLALLLAVGLVWVGCSSDDSGTAPDVTPPGAVTQLQATVQASAIQLNWSNPNDPDFDGIQVRRAETVAPTDSTGTLLFNGMASDFTDDTIVPGTDYIYAVFAFDVAGNFSIPTVKSVATIAPTTVTFNDPNLETIIRGLLSKPTVDILTTDMLTLTEVDLSNTDVNDLEGLQYCLNLDKLAAKGADLTDASHLGTVLSNLTKLRELDLRNNAITTIPDLSGLTLLRDLYLEDTDISSLTPLAGLSTLRQVSCGGPNLVHLTPLGTLTELTNVIISDSPLTDLASLSTLTNLRSLSIYGCPVTNLAPLSGLTSLLGISILDTPVSNLAPLSGLTSLTSLTLINNEIEDISAISGLTKLVYLNLASNHLLHDIQALVDNTGLGTSDQIILGGTPLLHEAVAVQVPALQARGANVILLPGLPVDMVGKWEIDNLMIDGEPADPAVFFDWETGAVTSRLILYFNHTYETADLDPSDTALYAETGSANVDGDQLTLTELTANGVDIIDGQVVTGTWSMVDDDLVITLEDEGSTAVLTWTRIP